MKIETKIKESEPTPQRVKIPCGSVYYLHPQISISKKMNYIFRNRLGAGKLLAKRLETYADRDDVLVLALPRGGVPVAFEVAASLHLLLDVFMVRKLGVPGYEELAMGAIASGGSRVLNHDIIHQFHIPMDVIDQITGVENEELQRRERLYRHNQEPYELSGKTIILIDDGIATGSTMRVAVKALRQHCAAKIIVAVPVASHSSIDQLDIADEVITLKTPAIFFSVGQFYQDFSQINDEEVYELLQCSKERKFQIQLSS